MWYGRKGQNKMLSFNPTKADAKKAITNYQALKNRVAGMREDARKVTKHLVRTAEVGGTAFAIGLVQGRTDGVEVLGVPVELLVGGGFTLFSLFNGAGEYSDHLAAVGDGALAAYATTLGRGVGVTMRQKALGAGGGTQSLPAGSAGAVGAGVTTKGVTLTPEEVAELAGVGNR
jgi:hypothetical protein